MVDKKLREAVQRYAEENDVEIWFLDNPSYDKSIVGISNSYGLVYDYELMIQEFMDDNNCEYIEAVEFIDYNTLRALSYYSDKNITIINMSTEMFMYHYGD